MLVAGFAAGAFQANCYLLATGDGADCVIVDPGQDAVEPIEQALRDHRLNPAAVLATHGHFDHVYSATTVADAHGIPVHIHPADRPLLSEPLKGLGPQLSEMFAGQVEMTEPHHVVELGDEPLELAGLHITVEHTPGHTPGSVFYRLASAEGGEVVLTGDTLFAGAIGRMDLPGGAQDDMARTLRERVLPLPDETVVLPGHGSTTTIGAERASNPFLNGLDSAGQPDW